MSFQNETTGDDILIQPNKRNFAKWVAIFMTGLFVLLCLILLGFQGPSFFIAFLMGAGAPGASLFFGLLILLVALSLIGSPFVILVLLFSKEKYSAIIMLTVALMILLGIFGGKYVWRPLELTASQVGIPLPDNAPSGILTLSEDFIPKNYYLGEKGETKEHLGTQYYVKGYYMKSQFLNIIRLMYNFSEPCFEFNKKEKYDEAICKWGECLKYTQNGYVGGSRSKDVTYAIDDHGSCVRVYFMAPNEKDALSEEQMIKVVDSLKRVPGQYVFREPEQKKVSSVQSTNETTELFKEQVKTRIKIVRSAMEAFKNQKGSYTDYEINLPEINLKESECVSTLHLDIAPDGSKYILYQPICPDVQQSYCTENGQAEIIIASTSLIQKTYHCR